VANYETADAVVDLLLEYPILMQRPIFVVGDHAVICRPSERALELL
jgi:arsenate reductase-like glutaredoxin family protein